VSEIFLSNIIKLCWSLFKLRSIMSGMFFFRCSVYFNTFCLICFP